MNPPTGNLVVAVLAGISPWHRAAIEPLSTRRYCGILATAI
jgi:hypothetical protein